MKVLVTGASGFIGSHVADLLKERNYEVRCIVRKTSNLRWLKDKGFELIEASLSSPESLAEAVKGVDYIIHSAGLTAAKDYEGFLKGNRDGTRNLIEAVMNHNPGIKKFLQVSSQTVSGPSKSLEQPVSEDMPPQPITSYGKSKLAAEQEVLKLKDKLPITIIRPPAVYGPRDTASVDLFKPVSKGFGLLIGFKPKYASIVHSTDLARGIVDAMESENTVGETYFVSSDQFYSWDKIYDAIRIGLGRKSVVKFKLPHFIVLTIAWISGFIGKFSEHPPVFNYEKGIDFIQEFWTCSIEKAKRDFGYEQKVSLEEGMKETARWYTTNKWI